ncbi:MAG: putative metal-dependent enzyme (double-stranded beta helix superfamily) [Gammaproteobacteria bacterium]|jgi:predicted metal-dependent enzyme (double-stranded beta helix superfamily)
MANYGLDHFLTDCEAALAAEAHAADRVTAIAPLMERLLEGDMSFLKSQHLISDPQHYARNAIYVAPDEQLSLFVLVWLPGQWTPVHDHGSWGVVGVLQGALEERSYMSADGHIVKDDGIALKRGGVLLLKEKSITSFVPNPDHIHMTGVPATRKMAASLHLYGRNMDSFHIYDVAQGTRRLIDLPQQKS